MKIVFDTNVYVSEALGGRAATEAVEAVHAARWRVFISDYILDELHRVMLDDLGFPRRAAVLAMVRAARRAKSVTLAASRHAVAADPKDSPILQTAIQAGAAYLVSSDAHLLALDPYEGLRIVSLAEFHRVLVNEGLLT